jgi:hypothetical protein
MNKRLLQNKNINVPLEHLLLCVYYCFVISIFSINKIKRIVHFATVIGSLLYLFNSVTVNAQTTAPTGLRKTITASFLLPEVEYTEIAVLSNVLRVQNNTLKTVVFSTTISVPAGWKTLNKSEKQYTLEPGDSLFIPVRLLTSNKAAKGGTKYNITAFIITSEGRQAGLASFRAGRPKIHDWEMHVLPRPRIYFLNGENTASFQYSLSNNGDEFQELLLSMSKIGSDFMITDTTGKIFRKNYVELALAPFSDTIIPLSVTIQKAQRNVKRIDSYNYLPKTIGQQKQYGLLLKASETGAKPGTETSKNSAVNFVKLNNITRVNQRANGIIPFTMLATVNNILGQQPVMNLVLNGNTQFEKSGLNYSLQTGFSSYSYGVNTLNNVSGIINYNHTRGFISAGTGVGLNMNNLTSIANGRGVAGGIRITPTQTIGAYFIRNGQSFTNYQSTIYGIGYAANIRRFRLGLGYGRSNDIAGNSWDVINGNIAIPLGRYQSFGMSGAIATKAGNIFNRRISSNYTARYLKSRGVTSITYTYSENGSILLPNSLKNINAGISNSFRIKKGYGITLQNNYTLFQTRLTPSSPVLMDNIMFNNILTLQLPVRAKVSYSPSIFMNYTDFPPDRVLSSGLQLNVNTYNPEENFRFGFFVKGGYNKLLNLPEIAPFFSAQSNAFLTFRTWTCNLRYAYGPIGQRNVSYIITQQGQYPQTFGGSIGNQYQFSNPHFITENTLNYNYSNANQRSGIGLFSQFFYYSNGGWRFGLNATYTYSISQSYTYVYTPGAVNGFTAETNGNKVKSHNFQLGVSVKKDFGIPIPKKFRKNRYCDVQFKTFLDINGNKKFDFNEVPLENIVIRVNDYEVLSSENGDASFTNIAIGQYKLQVLPLSDIGAWFPVVSDSIDVTGPGTIYIPFSKGVQILGDVKVDRERFSAGISEKIDISRIKIFLTDSTGHVITSVTDNQGNFKFYVPYGEYTLKLDEKILGTGFELSQNDVPLEFSDGMESYYHTFYIIEKKRKVKNKKFNADGSVTVTEGEAGSVTNTNVLNTNVLNAGALNIKGQGAVTAANPADTKDFSNMVLDNTPGPKLTALLYKQLVKKAEALLDNPDSGPEQMQELRNEVVSYLNSDLPDTSMKGMLLKYNEILNKPHATPNVIVKGTVVIDQGASKDNYANVSITVTDRDSKQAFVIKPNSKTGKYILILNRNKKYEITVQNKGYQVHTAEFSPGNNEAYEIPQVVKLKE